MQGPNEDTIDSFLSDASKASRVSISLSLDWDNIFKRSVAEAKLDILAATTLQDREQVEFCTGSSYCGKWNKLGMDGSGTYTYPYGCVYTGGMDDGRFHGKGTLTYPMGQKLECLWKKGKIVAYTFVNADGLDQNDHDWSYCKMPDRRFAISIREGLEPAGRERLTGQQPTRPIDPKCYDTGDGFFDPNTNTIVAARDVVTSEEQLLLAEPCADRDNDYWFNMINIASDATANWIKRHCRKGWDEAVGYRPEYYEHWTTGRRNEIRQIELEAEEQRVSVATEFLEAELQVVEPDERRYSKKSSLQYGQRVVLSTTSKYSSFL